MPKRIPAADPVAAELVRAVRGGDLDRIRALLDGDPDLASARFFSPDGRSRTPLHTVTDWPGYFPNGPEVARLLLAGGADPNVRTTKRGSEPDADVVEPGTEAPLHWAASSDDVDVAAVLIDGGADLELPDGSIGTPLDNAIGYQCWHVARLLVARGARVGQLWHASALGMLDRMEELLAGPPEPSQEQISQAFWHACAAAQRRAAERLLERGADLAWVPDYAEGTALDVARGRSTRRENVITWLTERGARPAGA